MGVNNEKVDNVINEYAQMFPMLFGAVLNHARNLLEAAYANQDVDLPGENENPKPETEEDKEAKEFLDDVTNGLNYFYSDDADDWKELNDGSEVDKKVKAVLDDFIFRIKIHQPDFDYKVAFNFKKKDGSVLKFRFFWNHDFDYFEGTCTEIEDVFFYNELEKKFEVDKPDCCDKCEEEYPTEIVEAPNEIPNTEKTNKKMGAQITVQEFEGDAPVKSPENDWDVNDTAKVLFDKLNKERRERKENYVDEIEIAVKRLIDYNMFEPVVDTNGTVYRISFTADDLQANIPHREYGNFLSVLTQDEVNTIIKDRFGFVYVQYCENDDNYYADLI